MIHCICNSALGIYPAFWISCNMFESTEQYILCLYGLQKYGNYFAKLITLPLPNKTLFPSATGWGSTTEHMVIPQSKIILYERPISGKLIL